MTARSPFRGRFAPLSLIVGLACAFVLGGCPVPQQITTNSNTNNNNAAANQNSNTNTNSGRPTTNRPIPTPTIDDTTTTDTDSGPTTTTDQSSAPIAIGITAPDGFDINILSGGEGFVSYEVFGGNPADGQLAIELFYDRDGIAKTGDEVTVQTALPPRGSKRFSANLPEGVYRIGIKASNRKDSAVAYASGRLVVVGAPGVTFTAPNANVRVRPNSSVAVQFSIQSLATAVSFKVFTDRDSTVNGNEVVAFNGAGLGGVVTIITDGFAPGNYNIGVTATDSTGQAKTEYFRTANGTLRTITVDLAPTIAIMSPTVSVLVDPANPPIVPVTVQAMDPEGAAQVTLFRDGDGTFNGNEFPLTATPFMLTDGTQKTFNVDVNTGALQPGTYKFGAYISDGVGEPAVVYAPATVRLNAPPVLSVQLPAGDITRRAGASVQIRWTGTDPEGRMTAYRILFGPDIDGDHLPDGGQLAVFAAPLGGELVLPPTSFSFQMPTNDPANPMPPGRYVLGVRATDDANASVDSFAPGLLTIEVPQACCFMGQCFDAILPSECNDAGGTPQGDGVDCTTVACP